MVGPSSMNERMTSGAHRSILLKSWKQPETYAGSVGGRPGPHKAALRRIPTPVTTVEPRPCAHRPALGCRDCPPPSSIQATTGPKTRTPCMVNPTGPSTTKAHEPQRHQSSSKESYRGQRPEDREEVG